MFIFPLEPNVILNALSQTPLTLKQYSVIAVLVIPRTVLSIRHIIKFSNTHDVARLLRSWSMTEPLNTSDDRYDDRPSWHILSRAGIEFVGRTSIRLADLPCAPSPPGAEFAFHLTVAVLSDKS